LRKATSPKAAASTLLSTHVIKALANDSRLEIMRWLKEPRRHFPPQVEGDLVADGVCGLFIAQKLGVRPANGQRASARARPRRTDSVPTHQAMDVLQT
jgi:hypothetical protein